MSFLRSSCFLQGLQLKYEELEQRCKESDAVCGLHRSPVFCSAASGSHAGIGEQLKVDGGNTEPGVNESAGKSCISVYPRTTHDIPMTGLTFFWFESSGLQSKWRLADSQSLLAGGQLTQCYD